MHSLSTLASWLTGVAKIEASLSPDLGSSNQIRSQQEHGNYITVALLLELGFQCLMLSNVRYSRALWRCYRHGFRGVMVAVGAAQL